MDANIDDNKVRVALTRNCKYQQQAEETVSHYDIWKA